jgi:hypothetical protein
MIKLHKTIILKVALHIIMNPVRPKIVTVFTVYIMISYDMTSHSLVDGYQCFAEICHLHLLGTRALSPLTFKSSFWLSTSVVFLFWLCQLTQDACHQHRYHAVITTNIHVNRTAEHTKIQASELQRTA